MATRHAKPRIEEPGPLKYWSMIAFESMGAGALAITLVFAAILILVGFYVQVIWPLTDWDLVDVSLEPYWSGITMALVFVFILGSACGFWYFSGAAWRGRQEPAAHALASRRTPSRSRL